MNRGRYRLTREDVAFCLEQLSDGADIDDLAFYVFNLSGRCLHDKLREWCHG